MQFLLSAIVQCRILQDVESPLATQIMSKEKEGKEKSVKKVAKKNLKEKRADKKAKKG